jgi:hypothetical protein
MRALKYTKNPARGKAHAIPLSRPPLFGFATVSTEIVTGVSQMAPDHANRDAAWLSRKLTTGVKALSAKDLQPYQRVARGSL